MAGGPAGFTRGYTCPALLRVPLCFAILRVPGSHRLRRDFPDTSPRLVLAMSRPSNPAGTGIPAVWAPPRSLAATGGITSCFLFLRVLRCFSSPRSPPPMGRMAVRQTAGLPHSGTRGSTAACASPRLFAACRALHRLPEPQASAVRPSLHSRAPEWPGAHALESPRHARAKSARAGGIPLSFPTWFSSVPSCQRPACPKDGHGWRITDSNR